MLKAIDVAKYFLSLTDEDAEDFTSNLKLQKLLYYAQGLHLALYDGPLFPELIEAWTHGPVVPQVYYTYKGNGSCAIPAPDDLDFSVYDEKTRELLDEIHNVFGQFSAWKLRNMTHEEPPWKEVADFAGTISHDSMREYFKTLLK